MDLRALIEKYSTPGPRYTSYPTAPVWSSQVGPAEYKKKLQSDFLKKGQTLGLYVHLPFCESLCYYCGCNIQITKEKSRSARYVDALLAELTTVSENLSERRTLSQISWGGGTPTFSSISEIQKLHEGTKALFDVDKEADVSIEIDPRVTSHEQLELLRSVGFNRVSLGVQDFDPKVQQAVNRIQPADMTFTMLEKCRALGFTGINFDLIYGLPHQTLESFSKTIQEVIRMQPSRIALYNYARLPTLLKHQQILEAFPMPESGERVDIFLMAYENLTKNGYGAIGMDHFAHQSDSLFKAAGNGTLYRNFMGYVVRKGTDLIGVGASAIGEVGGAFFQNVKVAKDYEARVAELGLACFRGHRLSDDDRKRKWVIQSLMCQFELKKAVYEKVFGEKFETYFPEEIAELASFQTDGILQVDTTGFHITEPGRLFIRNIAMVFDSYLKQSKSVSYSKTV